MEFQMHGRDIITIGQLASRVGISVSAIRFYETKGLVSSFRNSGGQRRFLRSDVRRLSFVLITQKLGFSLQEIASYLAGLPRGRTPSQKDWAKISNNLQEILEERIKTMQLMKEKLDGCIGCGCLSLKKCAIYNPEDSAANSGAGPRYLLGDKPRSVEA